MSDKDQIRGRFVYNKENLLDNAAQLGTFFAPYSITFALVNASEYHTFSPSVTNEFRVGYNRFDENIPAGNFKYPGLDVFPNITLFDLGNGLNVGPDGNAPQFTIQNFYQICGQRQHCQRETQVEGWGRVPLVYFTAGLYPTISGRLSSTTRRRCFWKTSRPTISGNAVRGQVPTTATTRQFTSSLTTPGA